MIDATDFGDVSMLRDDPDPGNYVRLKTGGYCVVGTATSAMNPGDAVVVDTGNDDSYKTTTSANATTGAGFVVASRGSGAVQGMQWDYVSAIVNGSPILVRVEGIVLATAASAVSRGDRVGTSTTAGQVQTTTTAAAGLGRALQAASGAGSTFRVLISRS
jgi:hypothetical protein